MKYETGMMFVNENGVFKIVEVKDDEEYYIVEYTHINSGSGFAPNLESNFRISADEEVIDDADELG